MNTITNIGIGLTTQASNANWTQQAQQMSFANIVNPQFIRTVIMGTSGIQMLAGPNQTRVQAINIGDLFRAAVSVDINMTWPIFVDLQPASIFDNQLANSNAIVNASVEFSSITPVTYAWQYSNASNPIWTNITNALSANITGYNTNTLVFTPLNVAASWNFRCYAVTNNANLGSVNSNPITVTTISAPGNVSVVHPAAANFNVAVTGPPANPGAGFSYQWQISTDAGVTYSNQTTGGVYNNTNTNILSITNSTGLNTFRYRCLVNNGFNTINSNNAILTVT
jgi:hypothetical protein